MAKRYHSGFYEGYEGKTKQEAKDSSMLSKDPSAVANLPQGVIYKEFPKAKSSDSK